MTAAAQIAAMLTRRPPRLGHSRLIAIDGPSGAGKTMFAEELATVLAPDVTMVHTDDLLDGWEDQFTYWPRLQRQVLNPLECGEPGRYRCYDWVAGAFRQEQTVVLPAGTVIVEGVGAARSRRWASLTVFVTASRSVREARSLRRDGPELQAVLDSWRAREDLHFAADATAWRADVVIRSAV